MVVCEAVVVISELIPLLVAILVLQLACVRRELLRLRTHLGRRVLQPAQTLASLQSRLHQHRSRIDFTEFRSISF